MATGYTVTPPVILAIATGDASDDFTVDATGGAFDGTQTVTFTADDGNFIVGGDIDPGGIVTGDGTNVLTVQCPAGQTTFTFRFVCLTAGTRTISYTNDQGWSDASDTVIVTSGDSAPNGLSTVTFVSGTVVALVVDGVLIDGMDIYTVVSSSISFDEAVTGDDRWVTDSELEFDQIVCVEQDYVLSTGSVIGFAGRANARGSFIIPGTGLDDPPTGFKFPINFKRRTSDNLVFTGVASITGGYILDETCNPPKLVPNFLTWSTLTDEDWEFFIDAEWDMLDD